MSSQSCKNIFTIKKTGFKFMYADFLTKFNSIKHLVNNIKTMNTINSFVKTYDQRHN